MSAPAYNRCAWWDESADEPHRQIHDAVKKLEGDGRREKYETFERIYGDATSQGSALQLVSIVSKLFGEGPPVWQHTPVTRSIIDTQMNRLGRTRARPRFTPRRGDPDIRRRAQGLNDWMPAYMERRNIDALNRRFLMDKLVLGTGIIKGHREDGEPDLELVWPGNVHVDPVEEQNNCVTTLYETHAVPKEVLVQRYPDHKDDIENTAPIDDVAAVLAGATTGSDLVKVVDGWHMFGGRDKNGEPRGGVHIVCTERTTLNPDTTAWKRESWPYVIDHYMLRPRSFWGMGLVESLAGIQAELDFIDHLVMLAFEAMTPAIMARAGSVPKPAWHNGVGRVLEYEGEPPIPWVPPAISEQYLRRRQELEELAYRMAGISPFSSQSLKPTGLDSGTALNAHEDIEAERHALPSQSHERSIAVDVPWLLLHEANEICDDDSMRERAKLKVLGGKRTKRAIDYRDVRLNEDDVHLDVWPVSHLSRTIQGKIDQIDKMREMGLFPDPDEIFGILDIPDTEQYASLRRAKRDLAELMADAAMNGEDFYVHPYMDFVHACDYASNLRARGVVDGEPDDAMARLDEFIGAAQAEKARLAAEAAAAASPPPPLGPQGPPPGLPADLGMAMPPMPPQGAPPALALVPPEIPPGMQPP